MWYLQHAVEPLTASISTSNKRYVCTLAGSSARVHRYRAYAFLCSLSRTCAVAVNLQESRCSPARQEAIPCVVPGIRPLATRHHKPSTTHQQLAWSSIGVWAALCQAAARVQPCTRLAPHSNLRKSSQQPGQHCLMPHRPSAGQCCLTEKPDISSSVVTSKGTSSLVLPDAPQTFSRAALFQR